MKFDYKKDEVLKNGLDIISLEVLITNALLFLKTNEIDWLEGIELINDLIYLRWHDDSIFSKEISEKILNWIEEKYDNGKILDYTIFKIEGNTEEEKSAKRFKLTIDTISHLNIQTDVLSFVQNKLTAAKTEFEERRLSETETLLNWKLQNSDKEPKLDSALKDEILKRTDEYFKLKHVNKPWYKEGNYQHLICGRRETISEHESSYSIYWCLVSEKYLSRSKRSISGGAGALFISKKMDLIKWSGSAPIDWVEWFELEVHQQEIYWVLEIDFNKRKISKIKPLLKASTSEVLKMVNDEFKIRVEDEQGRLEYMKKELNKYKIESTLHKLKRSRNNNG